MQPPSTLSGDHEMAKKEYLVGYCSHLMYNLEEPDGTGSLWDVCPYVRVIDHIVKAFHDMYDTIWCSDLQNSP